jgi:hypothetical protein
MRPNRNPNRKAPLVGEPEPKQPTLPTLTNTEVPNSSVRFVPEAAAAALALRAEVERLDDLLKQLAYLLNGLQPPRHGKVSIEWIRKSGSLVPVACVWRRTIGGRRWTYDEVGRTHLASRARSAHEFHDTHHLVRQVLRRTSEVLEQRADLFRTLSNLTQSTSQRVKASTRKRAGWGEGLDALEKIAAETVARRKARGPMLDDE